MAILNLLDLQPTTISRDLSDKYILIYGKAKVGKTTFASKIPNNLLFCFEKGVNFLPGVYAVDVPKWSTFKALLKQLQKDEVKAKYHTITIDTVSLAWELCTQFICQQNDVNTLGDLAYGRGYDLARKEFSNTLREITMLGYGVILIAHCKIQNESFGDESVIEKVSLQLPNAALQVVNPLVDIIGYIKQSWDENGNSTRTLITRATPDIVAGSRLKYLAPEIPFGYDELIKAINEAIDKEASIDHAGIVDKTQTQDIIIKRPFSETVAEARELWEKLVSADKNNVERILEKSNNLFGTPLRLSEIPESKQDLFEVLIEEMKQM